MPELLSFPVDGGKVNLSTEISTKYFEFGVHLLEDTTREHVSAIVKELKDNTRDINCHIFQEWLRGTGRPATWSSLVEVLETVQLNHLANQIRDAKGLPPRYSECYDICITFGSLYSCMCWQSP